MLQTLLAERFNLALHREAKEQTVYFLVPAKSGSKLKQSQPPAAQETQEARRDGAPLQMRSGLIMGRGVPISVLASSLGEFVGYEVIDRTQLSATFDFDLKWTPENGGADAELFAALEDQLGLRLTAGRAPVETLVIDRAGRMPQSN